MRVELIAHTALAKVPHEEHPSEYDRIGDYMTLGEAATDADYLAEFGGRSCYQAFHKPNAKTRENDAYLANILRQGHESVLAHASATFYITGVSRSLTHELIRSRFLAFSELSQRFVNMEDTTIVVPPLFADDDEAREILDNAMYAAQVAYERLVKVAEAKGATRKQAREAARAVLPGGTETRIVVSGNIRAWRDFIAQRWTASADAEIRTLAGEILRHLREIAPASVQDIPDRPFGSES